MGSPSRPKRGPPARRFLRLPRCRASTSAHSFAHASPSSAGSFARACRVPDAGEVAVAKPMRQASPAPSSGRGGLSTGHSPGPLRLQVDVQRVPRACRRSFAPQASSGLAASCPAGRPQRSAQCGVISVRGGFQVVRQLRLERECVRGEARLSFIITLMSTGHGDIQGLGRGAGPVLAAKQAGQPAFERLQAKGEGQVPLGPGFVDPCPACVVGGIARGPGGRRRLPSRGRRGGSW